MAKRPVRKKAAPKKKVRNPPAQLPPPEQRERLTPVSLHPLTFAQALKALVAVKPRGHT
jgi:hypothetical protein